MLTTLSARFPWRVVPVLAVLLTGAAVLDAARAQSGIAAVLGEGGPRTPRHGAGRHQPGSASSDEGELAPMLKPGPVQRLDAGALLCDTESELQQHEAVITVRLSGADAPEPAGCHLVQAMITVSVVDRHGPARTEVKTGNQLGWTDSMIRNP